jgi:hypothetical protein
MPRYTYRIDGENRLTAVGANWDDFLRANGGHPSSESRAVLGRSVFDFISGLDTLQLYHLLLQKVRRAGSPARVLLNCDSPDTRRRMVLTIQPEADGDLLFSSEVISVVAREPVRLPEGDSAGGELVSICSFCKQIEAPAGRGWVDVEAYLHLSAHFTKVAPPRLTHGVCPACYADAMRELARLEG